MRTCTLFLAAVLVGCASSSPYAVPPTDSGTVTTLRGIGPMPVDSIPTVTPDDIFARGARIDSLAPRLRFALPDSLRAIPYAGLPESYSLWRQGPGWPRRVGGRGAAQDAVGGPFVDGFLPANRRLCAFGGSRSGRAIETRANDGRHCRLLPRHGAIHLATRHAHLGASAPSGAVPTGCG